MKSMYREKIHRCGEYVEIDIFPVFKKAKGGRRAKYKPTSDMQARLNQRNAERALVWLLNANFNEDDISLTLTYDKLHLPLTYEDAERQAKNFLRRVKRLRAKMNLDEIKWVMIPGAGRYHFHIVMNGGIDNKVLQRIWPYGYCNSTHLIFNENGIEGLAKYAAKQFELDEVDIFSMFDINEETGEVTEKDGKAASRAKGKRRYTCSRNIIRPETEERDGEISSSKVEELATMDSNSRAVFEKLYPGYCFSSCVPYYNSENGGYYLQVKMYRSDAEFLQRRKKFNRIRN